MGTKMVSTYVTLTLVYLEENLYKVIGKNTTTIWKYSWSNINDFRTPQEWLQYLGWTLNQVETSLAAGAIQGGATLVFQKEVVGSGL